VRVPCKITGKKKNENPSTEICEFETMKCLVGMRRGEGRRGYRKEGGFRLIWKLWNIFPATQFL
jgi:hypothetical protein